MVEGREERAQPHAVLPSRGSRRHAFRRCSAFKLGLDTSRTNAVDKTCNLLLAVVTDLDCSNNIIIILPVLSTAVLVTAKHCAELCNSVTTGDFV
jgi:hypothetical protein